MKRILITGSNGFIGKNLAKRIQQLNYTVFLHDLDVGDITVKNCLDQYIPKNITHVFHLAGKIFVPESWKNPYSFYNVNFSGTLNVLEFCRKTNASIILLSSYPYGKPEYLPIDEKHRLKAYNPYGHSKLLAEDLCRYYSDMFDLHRFIFRVFNVYGPGQSPTFLIAEIIEKIRNVNESIVEVMDLRPRRDFVYIEDVIDALTLAIDGKPGIYNVGSGASISVKEIIEYLLKLDSSHKPFCELNSPRPNEVLDLFADIRLIKKELGWRPKTKILDGLKQFLIDFDKKSL